jgi:hypothetical protein
MRHKEFVLQVAKDRAVDKMEAVEAESDTDSVRPGPSTQTPHRPHGEHPRRVSSDIRKHALVKMAKSGEGKRKYPDKRCHVCATDKKKE